MTPAPNTVLAFNYLSSLEMVHPNGSETTQQRHKRLCEPGSQQNMAPCGFQSHGWLLWWLA